MIYSLLFEVSLTQRGSDPDKNTMVLLRTRSAIMTIRNVEIMRTVNSRLEASRRNTVFPGQAALLAFQRGQNKPKGQNWQGSLNVKSAAKRPIFNYFFIEAPISVASLFLVGQSEGFPTHLNTPFLSLRADSATKEELWFEAANLY